MTNKSILRKHEKIAEEYKLLKKELRQSINYNKHLRRNIRIEIETIDNPYNPENSTAKPYHIGFEQSRQRIYNLLER